MQAKVLILYFQTLTSRSFRGRIRKVKHTKYAEFCKLSRGFREGSMRRPERKGSVFPKVPISSNSRFSDISRNRIMTPLLDNGI